jgi:F0F1-type ATP synthase assembly protein I
VEENKQNMNNNMGPWWKPAVQIFTQVSVWIVIPILLALFIGKSLDAHFGTKPIIFLILAGVGFLFSCFGILRVIQKYMKEIASLASKNNEQNKEKNN